MLQSNIEIIRVKNVRKTFESHKCPLLHFIKAVASLLSKPEKVKMVDIFSFVKIRPVTAFVILLRIQTLRFIFYCA